LPKFGHLFFPSLDKEGWRVAPGWFEIGSFAVLKYHAGQRRAQQKGLFIHLLTNRRFQRNFAGAVGDFEDQPGQQITRQPPPQRK